MKKISYDETKFKLVPVAEHIYNGSCPEPEIGHPDERDLNCPACVAMLELERGEGVGKDGSSDVEVAYAMGHLFGQSCMRDAVAREFDRRATLVDGGSSSGWYEPDEPAEIARSITIKSLNASMENESKKPSAYEAIFCALELLRKKEYESCDYASNANDAASILERWLDGMGNASASAASQFASSETMMRALRDARDLAMKGALAARIPECGEFGKIAQDLDWVLGEVSRVAAG